MDSDGFQEVVPPTKKRIRRVPSAEDPANILSTKRPRVPSKLRSQPLPGPRAAARLGKNRFSALDADGDTSSKPDTDGLSSDDDVGSGESDDEEASLSEVSDLICAPFFFI